jgi:hypothetical protein
LVSSNNPPSGPDSWADACFEKGFEFAEIFDSTVAHITFCGLNEIAEADY